MIIKRIIVTPEMAKDFLDRCNTGNYRKPIPTVVSRYAKDMETNRWTETTATVAFSKSNVLIDGQNRLLAIIKSGKAITLNVLYDVDDSVVLDINQDRGSSRKLSTTLQHAGYKNATTVAACIRFLCRVANNNNHRGGNVTISDSAVSDLLDSMPEDFTECVNTCCSSKTLKEMAPCACLSAFYWLASCDDQEQANLFIDIMSKKKDSNAFCAANCVREQISSMRSKSILNETELLNYLLSAYKSFLTQRDTKLIKKTLQLTLTNEMQKELDRVILVVRSSRG
jgi:hypothetical protein